MRLLISSLGFAACLVAAGRASESPAPFATVEKALVELLGRAEKENSFVVVEDKKFTQFVQYSCDKEGLYIDIPLLKRADEEKQRIAEVFRSIGVDQPVMSTDKDVATGKPLVIRSYQAGFAHDSKKATQFGFRLFREAFLLKTIDLRVETD